ncbi:MAG: ribosome silencing factor [Candidatus Omnitrophica bacterium]|nr:ribosome silencing factor [Candidatus Omnitrophota bacterium]
MPSRGPQRFNAGRLPRRPSVETHSAQFREREVNLNARQIAIAAKEASDEKKGLDPIVLDIRQLTDIADYFVLVHGTSDRHVRTLAEGIEDDLHGKNIKPLHVEGKKEASWVLLDYGPVIVHVFHHERRKFYNLERLWGDGKILKVKEKHERKTKKAR